MPEKELSRLSDRVLEALELAIDQGDWNIGESLRHALELSMTRGSGGANFVERRDYPERVEAALKKLDDLKRQRA